MLGITLVLGVVRDRGSLFRANRHAVPDGTWGACSGQWRVLLREMNEFGARR